MTDDVKELNRGGGVVRVVVWNVAHRASTFDALEELQPDIALLNEAAPPSDSAGIWRDCTLGRDAASRPWSSAILTPHPISEITDAQPNWRGNTRDVPLECSRPGSWISGSIKVGELDLSVVSLYGLMDELSDSSVHRSLSEISPIMDDRRYRRNVLIGGDLNTGTQWPADDPFLRRDMNLLERFGSLGLADCLSATRPPGRLDGCHCSLGEECTHTRTRRDPRRPEIPYQTDYLFASKAMAARLVSCVALADDHWFSFSDHAPIVAEFRCG